MSGYFANGICHRSIEQARQAHCELYSGPVVVAGDALQQVCTPRPTVMDVLQVQPTAVVRYWQVSYPAFAPCDDPYSISSLEASVICSAIGVVWAAAWGIRQAVRLIRGSSGESSE